MAGHTVVARNVWHILQRAAGYNQRTLALVVLLLLRVFSSVEAQTVWCSSVRGCHGAVVQRGTFTGGYLQDRVLSKQMVCIARSSIVDGSPDDALIPLPAHPAPTTITEFALPTSVCCASETVI